MVCPHCKDTLQDEKTTCDHCGSALNLNLANRRSTDTITIDEIRAFVGNNSDYYIKKFSTFTKTGIEKFFPTWNWSAFCFTFIWMVYRKMYVQAVITFVFFCLPGINIILHIVAGVAGNYLYYKHAKKKILEIRSTRTLENLCPVLQGEGGVHKWVIWFAVIFSLILVLLIVLLFASIAALLGKLGGITV
ncbi:DUF2628 domain-containing protein [bacterium]|nr:DUF2628 domain-containing protein [bacterium]